jgi:rubrerythrin
MNTKDMRAGVCPICEHHEIIERNATEFTGKSSFEVGLAVAHGEKDGLLDHRLNHPFGRLVLYVCRSCGHVQWFAQNPAKIPIGDKTGTRLIAGPEKPLYR